jgi:hypothetical protein
MENISEAHKICKYAQEKKCEALCSHCTGLCASFDKTTSSAQAAQQHGCSALQHCNTKASIHKCRSESTKEKDELQKTDKAEGAEDSGRQQQQQNPNKAFRTHRLPANSRSHDNS